RNQTLGMIGDTATSLDDEYSTNIADGSLEELATADNEHHPKDLDEILDEDLNESLELKGLHLLPLSEIVTTKEKHKIDLSSDHADLGDGHTAELPVRHQWGFSGIDLDNTGHPVIGFANGVQITLTRECLESGSIQVGGHTINLTEVKGGLEIHLNGLKMFLPIAA
ncbi:MAG: hypothetical protein NTV34_07830, partial [Proteobacteria bacterium]|nr:hypothetical protein [Pseudomonadota bacterium]